MLKKKYWIYKQYDDVHINDFVKSLNISDITARLLISRGLTNIQKAESFLNSTIDHLYDPYLLKDMDKAVERIKKATSQKQSIWLYGDYDVDGISSLSVLLKYFKLINYPVDFYIPDRINEGYGLHSGAIESIKAKGGNLIITVDCGITSFHEVDIADKLGIDIIITDHHECQGILPKAIAIINPKQEACTYPFDMLCGCGIAFKLIQALMTKEMYIKHLNDFIDIVTIATVADMVPLIDENRIIVKYGLGMIEKTNNLGIQMLIESCGLEGKKITAGHIGYMIAPRINAAGRISAPQNAVKLLITEDPIEARSLAKLLSEENNKRQLMEAEILEEAFNFIESDSRYVDEKVLVVFGENWHHGVIGIVASRIVEKYHKPTIILTIENGVAKGSARSISKFNMFKALESCGNLFLKFGGHEQAAGLSLLEENVEIFRKRINEIADEILTVEDLVQRIYCDTDLPLHKIDEAFVEELSALEPYGIGNPSPQFFCINLKSKSVKLLGNDGKHIKIQFLNRDKDLDSIGFNMGDYANGIVSQMKLGAVFTPEFNYFNKTRKIQLKLKDLKLFSNDEISAGFENHYFEYFYLKDPIEQEGELNYSLMLKDFQYYEDKNFHLINLLYELDGPFLILVNTLDQAKRLLKIMEIRQNNSSREVNVLFNDTDKECHENTIDIIINPNIDKIRYKIYNNIIAYDMFFKESDLFKYISQKSPNRKMLLYEKNDEKDNEKLLESITPSRMILASIYKGLKDKCHNRTLSYDELRFELKDNYLDMNKILLKRSLTIFLEGDLIKNPFNVGEDKFRISIIEKNSKIKIEELKSFKLYNSHREDFIKYKNKWLNYIKEEKHGIEE